MGRRGSVNSDFGGRQRPASVQGIRLPVRCHGLPWPPIVRQPEIGWRRPWSRKTHRGLVNRQGGARRHDSSSRAAATGPRPEKEGRFDLPKQPCSSTQSIRRDARDTADNSSNARSDTWGPEGAPVGDRGYRCRNVRGRSRFPRRRATGGRGEGRETWRREDGREQEDRDAKVKKKKAFSLLSSLLESLFAVCTRALSLSLSLALAQAAAAFPSQQPPGPGRGRGGKRRVSRTLGGGWPATKLKIEWIGGPSGAQRTGTGRRAGGRRWSTALRKRATLLEILNGRRVCFWQLWAGPVCDSSPPSLAAGRLKASSHCQGKSWPGFLDHQSSAPLSHSHQPAKSNVHHSPLCRQVALPPAIRLPLHGRFDPRPRRGRKKRGIRPCTWHGTEKPTARGPPVSCLGQSSPSFRLSSHAKRRRRHKT